MSFKIKEAEQKLSEGKIINSANANATLEPFEKEGQKLVKVIKTKNGKRDEMHLTLSRVTQVYALHDFSDGGLKDQAAPNVTKPAAPEVTK